MIYIGCNSTGSLHKCQRSRPIFSETRTTRSKILLNQLPNKINKYRVIRPNSIIRPPFINKKEALSLKIEKKHPEKKEELVYNYDTYEEVDRFAYFSNQRKNDPTYIFVKPKYIKFKNEMKYNKISNVSELEFLEVLNQAITKSKEKKPKRYKSRINLGKIKQGDSLDKEHIIAILFYTNFDDLCFEFRKYFRTKKNRDENYQEFGHLARLLFEVVYCFGANTFDHKIIHCGLNKTFLFENGKITPGPFSTSKSYSVAKCFASLGKIGETGMILGLKTKERFMDFSHFSKHSGEEEFFFIGSRIRIIDMTLFSFRSSRIKDTMEFMTCLFEGHTMTNNYSLTKIFNLLERGFVGKKLNDLKKYEQILCLQIRSFLNHYASFVVLNQTIKTIVKTINHDKKSIPKSMLNFKYFKYGKTITDFAKVNNKSIYYFDSEKKYIENKNENYSSAYTVVNLRNEENGSESKIYILIECIINNGMFHMIGHQITQDCRNHLKIHARLCINGESFSNDFPYDRHFLNYCTKIQTDKIDIEYLFYIEKNIYDSKMKKSKTVLKKLELKECKKQEQYIGVHNFLQLSIINPFCFECKIHDSKSFINYLQFKSKCKKSYNVISNDKQKSTGYLTTSCNYNLGI